MPIPALHLITETVRELNLDLWETNMTTAEDTRPVLLIQVESKYGRLLAYPASDAARGACLLTGTKTLRASDLAVLQAMGYRVEVAGANPRNLQATLASLG